MTVGGGYGYAGRISFGKNGGRWNVNFGFGYGLGLMGSFTPQDTGRSYASSGNSAYLGVEMSADVKIGGLDVGLGNSIGTEADSCNKAEFTDGLFGTARIPGTLLNVGGVLNGTFRSNLSGKIGASPQPVSIGVGGMAFAGITGGWSWDAN